MIIFHPGHNLYAYNVNYLSYLFEYGAIGQLGITRIIVAHRKETIMAASQRFALKSNFLQKINLTHDD